MAKFKGFEHSQLVALCDYADLPIGETLRRDDKLKSCQKLFSILCGKGATEGGFDPKDLPELWEAREEEMKKALEDFGEDEGEGEDDGFSTPSVASETFSCGLCKEVFKTEKDLLDHKDEEHEIEEPEFDVPEKPSEARKLARKLICTELVTCIEGLQEAYQRIEELELLKSDLCFQIMACLEKGGVVAGSTTKGYKTFVGQFNVEEKVKGSPPLKWGTRSALTPMAKLGKNSGKVTYYFKGLWPNYRPETNKNGGTAKKETTSI